MSFGGSTVEVRFTRARWVTCVGVSSRLGRGCLAPRVGGLLLRRAGDGTVRAEDATIPRFGPQFDSAVVAGIANLARHRGHGFRTLSATLWALDNRYQFASHPRASCAAADTSLCLPSYANCPSAVNAPERSDCGSSVWLLSLTPRSGAPTLSLFHICFSCSARIGALPHDAS